MTELVSDHPTTFEAFSSIYIQASPNKVYSIVSDLKRSGEWSPECRGGTWISGKPGEVGSVFRGDNYRKTDVVAWAPVIRGAWNTYSEVISAKRNKLFQWVILNSDLERQDSVWSFDIKPSGNDTQLVHRYRLGKLTEGLSKILSGLTETDRQRFITEWNAKLNDDIAATLSRIKNVIEAS